MMYKRLYDRDNDIYNDYKNGMSFQQLMNKYHLKRYRIKHIIEDQLEKRTNGDVDIYEIDAVCRMLGIREQERGRIQSALHRNGYTALDTKWLVLDYNDICSLELLDKNSAWIIWLAQHIWKENVDY